MSAYKKRLLKLAPPTFLALTVLSWGHSIEIYAKAYLAQVLIQDAWHQTLNGGNRVTPWPWADTWPVAKLYVNSSAKEYYVLAGSHGTSLAFGPGHLDGSAAPGAHGTSVISGHRDTHFSFLENQHINDRISLQLSDGHWVQYKIIAQVIRSTEDGPWLIDKNVNELHLVTCYPFNSPIPGGKLRYITIAEKVEHDLTDQHALSSTSQSGRPLSQAISF